MSRTSSHESVLARTWPLIGRDRELGAIAAARTALGCHAGVVVGDAGVGKSRLAREAVAAAERDGAYVAWVRATCSAATVPLGAVADLVPDEVRSDDMVTRLRRSSEGLREAAGGGAAVVGVDDAQLLDPASAALINHLATTGAAFVLATVRAGEPCPDAITALWKDDGAPRIELGTLGDEDVRALIEAVLEDPIEEQALRWVTEVSGGNVLYVRELVNGAIEAGTLVHDEAFWRLEGRPAAPRSLVDVVAVSMVDLEPLERDTIELLALGEPLAVGELAGLTSEPALLSCEARGLIVGDHAGIRLAHPLYGETVRAALPPLRGRSLRLRLVDVFEGRRPFGPDEALRVARLRLDAGVALPGDLTIEAARAANRAGDPELGGQLAELAAADGAGLSSAMLLAQAHAMRNRYAEAEVVLAAAEPLARGQAGDFEYVKQRLSLLHWSLRRDDEVAGLLQRAADWEESERWQGFIERMRSTYLALADGFGPPELSAAFAANETLPDESRRLAGVMHRVALLIGGQGNRAAEAAFAARPGIPLRDAGDAAALSSTVTISIDTGNGYELLEEYAGQVVRAGIRGHDQEATGLGSIALARLHLMRGRLRDAARWRAEADVHLRQRDSWGILTIVRTVEVGIAFESGSFDATAAAGERLQVWLANHEPVPVQRVPVRRAERWVLAIRDPGQAGRLLLEDAEAFAAEAPGLAPLLAYEALRLGAPAAGVLEALAVGSGSRLVAACAAHARAKAAGTGAGLLAAAEEMAAIGARRYAVEGASDAAAAFVAEGRSDSARRAAARARELHIPGQGTELPGIDGLDATAVELTPREAQLIALASEGLSNAEIGDRLVISVRTVETHLYRGMQKLGISDRRDLRTERR
jgi:DNA-binding CsgD family transcriptional regulator